ncbi:hypothetical protein ABZ318_37545 [Streptomyces sp. NPDC006197]|uniref:hypothetical protein n=1 Tax=Streptomyces sp. NPDC006197 TaxID=3156685 RepID=UPI0033B85DCE
MTDGFPNKPKILRGAFVEFGLSLPPLVVVFQYNPVQLSRNRALTFGVPGDLGEANGPGQSSPGSRPTRDLREFHGGFSDLQRLQEQQLVTVAEQTIGFDIRLDATDRLDESDTLTEQFGIAPQIATLELMVQPKQESLLGSAVSALLGKPKGFSFTRRANPPMVLFIFGRKRVLPVNINTMQITETEFSADLNPLRATVAVGLTVIEGKNMPYLYSKAMTEAMSVLNLASIVDVSNVVLPG